MGQDGLTVEEHMSDRGEVVVAVVECNPHPLFPDDENAVELVYDDVIEDPNSETAIVFDLGVQVRLYRTLVLWRGEFMAVYGGFGRSLPPGLGACYAFKMLCYADGSHPFDKLQQ